RVSELGAVLLESGIRFSLGNAGLLDVPLNERRALVENLAHLGKCNFPDDKKDDDEAHGRPNDVVDRWEQRTRRSFFGRAHNAGNVNDSSKHDFSLSEKQEI